MDWFAKKKKYLLQHGFDKNERRQTAVNNSLKHYATPEKCKERPVRNDSALCEKIAVVAGHWWHLVKTPFYPQLTQNWVVGWVWFLFFTPHLHHKTTHEERHFRLLCRFNFFKLVCIRSIPNNSRTLLQSDLMNIRFWKRKKTTAFFALQWDYSWFFFVLMKWFSLSQKKCFKIGIFTWAKALTVHFPK